MSGWGVKFLDYDNDGNVDLFIVSGHPDNKVSQLHSEIKYEENPLLFAISEPDSRRPFKTSATRADPSSPGSLRRAAWRSATLITMAERMS